MNNSSFLKQSTNISYPLVAKTKLVPLEVKTKRKVYMKTTKHYKKTKQQKRNEQKNKQKFDKTYKQHKKKKKTDIDYRTQKNNKNNKFFETYQQWGHCQ